MFCFRIEKNESVVGEIRAPIKSSGDYWVMQNVCVRAKPNSQVGEWSHRIYLIHTYPANGALPDGTKKHHLFKRKLCKGNVLVQSAGELAVKIKELMKCVRQVSSEMKTWDEVDTNWWNNFESKLKDMSKTQSGVAAAPPDAVLLHRISTLMWGTEHAEIGSRAQPRVAAAADPALDHAFRALAILVQPRTALAGDEQWGRTRGVMSASWKSVRMRAMLQRIYI